MSRFTPTAPEALTLAGALLYGAHWRKGLAEALGVDHARLRRLLIGSETVSPSLLFLVRVAVQKRRAELLALERHL